MDYCLSVLHAGFNSFMGRKLNAALKGNGINICQHTLKTQKTYVAKSNSNRFILYSIVISLSSFIIFVKQVH